MLRYEPVEMEYRGTDAQGRLRYEAYDRVGNHIGPAVCDYKQPSGKTWTGIISIHMGGGHVFGSTKDVLAQRLTKKIVAWHTARIAREA